MKEFEEWFEKNKPYEIYSCMNMAEKTWRAALKWVLKNLEEQYEHIAQGDTGWQGKFIEKELSGK